MRAALLFCLVICLNSVKIFAGFVEKDPIVWNQFNPYELNLITYESDTTASAVVLCDYGTVTITNRTIYTRILRIKILKDAGIPYSQLKIAYDPEDEHDKFTVLKGHTIDIKNGEIIKTYPLTRKNIKDTLQSGIAYKILQFPNVRVGSIIEYEYEIASLDFVKLREWYFQSSIPVIWSEFRFETPLPFYYLLTYEKGDALSNDEQVDFANTLTWLYNTDDKDVKKQIADNNYAIYETYDRRYKVYFLNDIRKKIIYKDLPALGASEALAYQAIDYSPKLKIHLFRSQGNLPRYFDPLLASAKEEFDGMTPWQIYNNPDTDPVGYIHYQLETWDQFNDRLLKSKRFGIKLQHPVSCIYVIDSIKQATSDQMQQIKGIYGYVYRSIAWNNMYNMKVDESLRKVFEAKSGNSGEKNLLLIYMLRKAGFTADPVLVRTLNLGRVEEMYPAYKQFNHLICMVTIEGRSYLLDALSPGTLNKIYPAYCKEGFLVKEEQYGWVDLFTGQTSQEFVQK